MDVIWFSNVWKARNAFIFSKKYLDWEKVMENYKILAWKILRY